MAICHCCVQRIKNPIQFWFSEFDKMKQKSEGIGLVVGRVQRIEEEAANASLKVIMMILIMMMIMVDHEEHGEDGDETSDDD